MTRKHHGLLLGLLGASIMGCGGAPSATLSGLIEGKGYSLDNPVVLAETASGVRYVTHVKPDYSFALTVPVGETYRFALANTTREGIYRVLSTINVDTDAGPSRYFVVDEGAAIGLGTVRPIVWDDGTTSAALMTASAPQANDDADESASEEDPGNVTDGAKPEDDGKPDDVKTCDANVGESQTDHPSKKGVHGVGKSGQMLGAGTTKVTVCHIPPGNPANAHEITIGSPGVPAHLAHGDYLGACLPEQPAPPPACDPAPTDPPPPAPNPPPATCVVNVDCGAGYVCLDGICNAIVL